VPRSVYFTWQARAQTGQLADTSRGPCSYDRLLPDEVAAINAFALRHPKTGYRKLSYMMLDQDIVAACESAVYRVLREADLLSRWKRSSRSSGVYTSFQAPTVTSHLRQLATAPAHTSGRHQYRSFHAEREDVTGIVPSSPELVGYLWMRRFPAIRSALGSAASAAAAITKS